MSGFDNKAVDAAFFAETPNVTSNFIATLGHGDPATIFGRLPRPAGSKQRRRGPWPLFMLTLVIETATAACSVALIADGAIVAARHEVVGRGHAERLLPMIAELPGGGRADHILVDGGPPQRSGPVARKASRSLMPA
eukprot:gene7130-9613_t